MEAMQYLEDLLHNQVVAALGREITSADFNEYMTFHQNKVFHANYRPNPFSHSIRRSQSHSPEGFISINVDSGVSRIATEPLYTLSRTQQYIPTTDTEDATSAVVPSSLSSSVSNTSDLMSFSLSATTSVRMGGSRHLHATVMHSFTNDVRMKYELVASARQFSSFILLLGRMSSGTTFDPKYAVIVNNKDELKIPLDFEYLPTAKEFRDAIASISPEQQQVCGILVVM